MVRGAGSLGWERVGGDRWTRDAMPPEQAELRLETGTADGWSELPAELLEKVLEKLQADGGSKPQEGR